MFKKFFKFFVNHKFVSFIIIILVSGGSYWAWQTFQGKAVETRYVVATVAKGTLINSISGTGQISASNQVEIKPKASGDLLSVTATVGQEVKAGSVLAQINASDAYKTVRDAQANLENAKISLAKLEEPTDALSILQAENSLTQAQESKQSAQDDLNKAYEDGFNAVTNVFLDLPNIMSGLNDLLFLNTLNAGQANLDYYADSAKQFDMQAITYRDDTNSKYQAAKTKYEQNFIDYKTANRFSDTNTMEALINESYDTTRSIAEAVKSASNLIQFYKDTLNNNSLRPSATADTHLTSLSSYTSKTNSSLSSLLSVKNTIQNDKQTIVSADRSIEEKTQSLAKLKEPVDALDLKSQQLSVQQRENTLADAREKLADYTIRAPFDGVIAQVDAKKGEAVSSATTIATLITKQKIAEVSLNEVDAAKVKVGQKATITFDAVADLSITGEVGEMDTLGTVSQGVVTYNIKIVFDTQDDRVKPGMSASVSIITDIRQDVLLVANSAIKSLGNTYYVEMPSEAVITTDSTSGVVLKNVLRQQTVEIGLANDSMTEVTSGLVEGDQIVVRSVSPSSSSANTNSSRGQNLFQLGGGEPR